MEGTRETPPAARVKRLLPHAWKAPRRTRETHPIARVRRKDGTRAEETAVCRLSFGNKGIDPKMIANNLEPSEPTHPGELIKEEIEYRGISQKKLAQETGISYKVLNDILNGRRPVTANTALLVEAALGIPAHILTGLQMDYNMQTAKQDKSFMERLASIRKIAALL